MALRGLSWRDRPGVWIAGAFFLAHLPLLSFAELSGDESLYWLYARHLDWGYLTNPPLVGWIVAASTAVFGDGVVAVRLGVLLVASLGVFGLSWLGRALAGSRGAWYAVALFLVVPLSWLYGFLAAPDVLLVALVALSLASAVMAWRSGHPSLSLWAFSGAFLGLAFLAKYTAALTGLAIAPVMAGCGRGSRWKPLAAWSAAGLGVAAPHLAWFAARHGDPLSLRIATHGNERVAGLFGGSSLLHFLGTQIAVWSPVIVVLVLWALWKSWRKGLCREEPWLAAMGAATVLPLVAFVVWSRFGPVHPYWTGVALPPACGLVAAVLSRMEPGRRRMVWRVVAVQTVLLAGVAAVLLAQAGNGRGYIGRRIQWRSSENRRLAVDVGRRLAGLGDGALLTTSHGYATVSQLAFCLEMPDRAMVLAPRGVARQLADWASPDWLGRPGVFVAPGPLESFPLAVYFESCSVPETLDLGGSRSYTLASCEGYRGPAPWLWRPAGGGVPDELAKRLYRGLLGREPDGEGIRSVRWALSRGELAHLVWNMVRSPEYRDRFGTESPKAAVRRIWLGLSGSPPSPDQLEWSTDLLAWAGPQGLALRLLEPRSGGS